MRSRIFVITSLLVNILSGGMFPLEIFGESVVKALQYTPFPYTIYFPVNILSGKAEAAAMYQGRSSSVGGFCCSSGYPA